MLLGIGGEPLRICFVVSQLQELYGVKIQTDRHLVLTSVLVVQFDLDLYFPSTNRLARP